MYSFFPCPLLIFCSTNVPFVYPGPTPARSLKKCTRFYLAAGSARPRLVAVRCIMLARARRPSVPYCRKQRETRREIAILRRAPMFYPHSDRAPKICEKPRVANRLRAAYFSSSSKRCKHAQSLRGNLTVPEIHARVPNATEPDEASQIFCRRKSPSGTSRLQRAARHAARRDPGPNRAGKTYAQLSAQPHPGTVSYTTSSHHCLQIGGGGLVNHSQHSIRQNSL